MTYAVLFPGQGSQTVGMGAHLFDLRPDLLGDAANEILGWSLRQVVLEGPDEVLTRTEYAQPAIFALSYALWSLLEEAAPPPAAGAGHSLGEYTALCASGALGFDEALDLVNRRGIAMAKAADSESTGMAALLGADVATAQAACDANQQEGGTLSIANLNAPGQTVVAGSRADISWLDERGRQFGIRRVVALKVSGAFHTSYMEPAAAEVEPFLSEARFGDAGWPVWSNTTAAPHQKADLGATLRAQIVSPVRFAESLEAIGAAGIQRFVHVGPGDVTAGMARRTLPTAGVSVVSSVDDIPAFVREL